MAIKTAQQIDSTTQQFLDIFDITNDLVILKDGTTSLIITVDAMNFGLLAEEEQDSIMYAYAGLLNSLNYPIQIVIKSQTKDVTGYLQLLKDQEDAATSRLQQQRIMKYREFVSNLIRERNVLDKKFYVTIPAKPLELGLVPVSSLIPGQSQTDISTVDKSMVIEKARGILEPKRDHLIAQFARIGLYSRQLETQEIIQLFYQSYNPEASDGQTMGDSKGYTTPLVTASIENVGMNSSLPQQFTPAQEQQDVAVNPVALENPTIDGPIIKTPMVEQSPPLISTPVITPVLGSTSSQNSQSISYSPTQMTQASLPPSPELPKTTSKPPISTIPEEIEIQIDHPNSTNVATIGLGSPVSDITSAPPVQADSILPPLPEIQ